MMSWSEEGVSETVATIRRKPGGQMNYVKCRVFDEDETDVNEAERHEAWKAREIARIKEDLFNTEVASYYRELLARWRHEKALIAMINKYKPKDKDGDDKDGDDSDAVGLKLPQEEPTMMVSEPSTIRKMAGKNAPTARPKVSNKLKDLSRLELELKVSSS